MERSDSSARESWALVPRCASLICLRDSSPDATRLFEWTRVVCRNASYDAHVLQVTSMRRLHAAHVPLFHPATLLQFKQIRDSRGVEYLSDFYWGQLRILTEDTVLFTFLKRDFFFHKHGFFNISI